MKAPNWLRRMLGGMGTGVLLVLKQEEKARKWLKQDLLRKFGYSLVGLVVGVFVLQHYRNPAIILVPLSLPNALEETGLSGRELTERLLDRIKSLRESAQATSDKGGFVLESQIQYPDIEIPGVHMNIPQFLSFLDGTFGHNNMKVQWQVSARPKTLELSHDNWIVTAAVSGGHLHQAVFPIQDPDAALTQIAMAVLTDAEPFVAIRALRFAGRCEDARTLAGQQAQLAHTKRDLARAHNVMGFVSECTFPTTGPNSDDAELFYKRAIAIDPRDPEPHANLGRLLAQEGDSAAAFAELDSAARLNPQLAATYEAWGEAKVWAGDYKGAIPKYRRALELDPTLASAYIALANSYLNDGDTTEAINQFGPGVFRRPDLVSLTQYGDLLTQRRRFKGAADAFYRAVQLDPTNIETQFKLGVALDSGGNLLGKRVFHDLAQQLNDTNPYCDGIKRHLPEVTRCGRALKVASR
jgi:tetratricopeptide (TPR) repeat protein